MSPYQVLGVRENATQADIKAAFRKRAMECHPDRHPGDKAKEDQFKRLSEANEILSRPDRRARYDQAEKRRRAQAEQQRRTGVQPQPWRPPMPTARTVTSQEAPRTVRPQERPPSSPPPGQTQGTLDMLRFGGLMVYGLSRVRWTRGTYWDPRVRRHRGPDGRFRPAIFGVPTHLR